MTEKDIMTWQLALQPTGMDSKDSNKELDNRHRYTVDNQPSPIKLLTVLFKDVYNPCEEIIRRDEHNALIKEKNNYRDECNALIKKKNFVLKDSCETTGAISTVSAIQRRLMKDQCEIEIINENNSTKEQIEVEGFDDHEETSPKQSFVCRVVEYWEEEKLDKEKDEIYVTPEVEDMSSEKEDILLALEKEENVLSSEKREVILSSKEDDCFEKIDNNLDVLLKEDLEVQEKISCSDSGLCYDESSHFQHLSGGTFDDNQLIKLEVCKEHMESKADVERSEKELNIHHFESFSDDSALSVTPDSLGNFSDFESFGDDSLLTVNQDDINECYNEEPEVNQDGYNECYSRLSQEQVEGFECRDTSILEQLYDFKNGCFLYNALSTTTKISQLSLVDLNIQSSSLESTVTSSFNYYEDGPSQIAANMMQNNIWDKQLVKQFSLMDDGKELASVRLDDNSDSNIAQCRSPSGGDVEEKQSKDLVNQQASGLGQHTTLIFSDTRPRRRSGSNKKSRGKRQDGGHRSRKNSRGHKNNGGGKNSKSGGNSLDAGGGGCSSGGDEGGEEGGRDRKQRGSVGRTSDDEDVDEDEEESEDENKSEEEGAEGEKCNLLPDGQLPQDKTLDKDLTPLLSELTFQRDENAVVHESVFQWQIDSESNPIAATSLPHEPSPSNTDVTDTDGLQSLHSCIPLDTLCDIIGGATMEEYTPRDDILLPLNPCLTTLTHDMFQAYEGDMSVQDCQHCSTLAALLQHIGKCDANASCFMCIQAYNLVLHHTQMCIQTGRQQSPTSRSDLCHKLCDYARWDPGELFASNKIYHKMTIKKYCNKILTQPYDQEVSSNLESSDTDQAKMPESNLASVDTAEQGDVEIRQSSLRSSFDQGDMEIRQSSLRSSVRKSSSFRHVFPPSISEEDEKGEDDSVESNDNSAMAILRRDYEAKADDTFALSERDYITSLPQVHINDQTQFNSFVNRPMGVKGVGEVVYDNVAQLRLVAGYWEQKRDEFERTGKRPYQRYEEGVILRKYKRQFQILGTRYQLNFQWHKLTSLGSGMSGRCYLAMDKSTQFQFCVKKINLIVYKKEELSLWSDLNHPNIVKLFGALRHADVVYLFIEYVDGGDLAHCIDDHKIRGERLSHWLALTYFQQMLDLLVYLETKNLLHEDIKADNLLLRASSFYIVLTDFGLCHRLQKPVELKNLQPVGTATHFSPEKAASMGHGIPACVWACVCVLVHMLSGQQPWHKYLKKVDYLNFTIYFKPPPLEDVPSNIRAIVKDLIAQGFTKDPEKRPNARELLKHEAFDILKQETETYLSTLVSVQHSNGNMMSKTSKDKGAKRNTAVKDTAAVGGAEESQDEQVSLYEISLPNNSILDVQRKSVLESSILKSENQATENSVIDAFQAIKIEDLNERQDETNHEGGGDASHREPNEEPMNPISNLDAINRNIDNNAENKDDAQEVHHSDNDVNNLITGKVPDLDMLLQSTDPSDQIRCFLTDDSSSLSVKSPHLPLEVFNPETRSVTSDQLPNLSIFEPYSWDKNIAPPKQQPVTKNDEIFYSDEISNSSELFAEEDFEEGSEAKGSEAKVSGEKTSGSIDSPTASFKGKKPHDLTLDVVPPPLKHQTSKKSSASSSSSVFYPGSASSAALVDIPYFHDFAMPEESSELPEDEEDNKSEVENALETMRRSINEDKLDGQKLTLYSGLENPLFDVRISDADMKMPSRHHISALFKGKLRDNGIHHFELATMEGQEIDYNSRLKTLKLKVLAKPHKKQCWCAGCQF